MVIPVFAMQRLWASIRRMRIVSTSGLLNFGYRRTAAPISAQEAKRSLLLVAAHSLPPRHLSARSTSTITPSSSAPPRTGQVRPRGYMSEWMAASQPAPTEALVGRIRTKESLPISSEASTLAGEVPRTINSPTAARRITVLLSTGPPLPAPNDTWESMAPAAGYPQLPPIPSGPTPLLLPSPPLSTFVRPTSPYPP